MLSVCVVHCEAHSRKGNGWRACQRTSGEEDHRPLLDCPSKTLRPPHSLSCLSPASPLPLAASRTRHAVVVDSRRFCWHDCVPHRLHGLRRQPRAGAPPALRETGDSVCAGPQQAGAHSRGAPSCWPRSCCRRRGRRRRRRGGAWSRPCDWWRETCWSCASCRPTLQGAWSSTPRPTYASGPTSTMPWPSTAPCVADALCSRLVLPCKGRACVALQVAAAVFLRLRGARCTSAQYSGPGSTDPPPPVATAQQACAACRPPPHPQAADRLAELSHAAAAAAFVHVSTAYVSSHFPRGNPGGGAHLLLARTRGTQRRAHPRRRVRAGGPPGAAAVKGCRGGGAALLGWHGFARRTACGCCHLLEGCISQLPRATHAQSLMVQQTAYRQAEDMPVINQHPRTVSKRGSVISLHMRPAKCDRHAIPPPPPEAAVAGARLWPSCGQQS